MGRGTINSENGAGLYSVDLDYGSAELNKKIADIQAVIDELTNNAIPDLLNDLASAGVAVSLADAALQSAIAAFTAAGSKAGSQEERDVKDATKTLRIKRSLRDAKARDYNRAALNKRHAELQLNYYSSFVLTGTVNVWCVDYTEQASGDVGTIEIPGEPNYVNLVPGCASPVNDDGEVKARVIQSSMQSYWNIAALPAWQKWSPTYRYGVIDTIDRLNDKCDLTLEDIKSSEHYIDTTTTPPTRKQFSINQTDTLSAVPIVYMECNSRAFIVGDEVVVKFTDNDWDQPVVIGFKDNPRQCATAVIRARNTYPVISPERWYIAMTDSSDLGLINSARQQVESVPTLPYTNRIIVEVRADGNGTNDWYIFPLADGDSFNPTTKDFWSGLDAPSGYENIIWIYDPTYVGPVQSYVNILDTTGDYIDWSTYYRLNELIYYEYSYNQTDTQVLVTLFPQELDAEIPAITTDIIEIKIRVQYGMPTIPDRTYLHLAIKRSTNQVYGHKAIDLVAGSDPVTELAGYTFPPDNGNRIILFP